MDDRKSTAVVAVTTSQKEDVKEKPASAQKKILDEETYSEHVERIIVRDFFPDHQHLQDQKEYLEAEENRDFVKMRQIALRKTAGGQYGAGMLRNTPIPSPAPFETPLAELRRQATGVEAEKAEKPKEDEDEEDTADNFGYKKKKMPSVEEESVKDKDTEIGLDKFLSKYTSEDNDSFETIMERSEQARREKHAWLYEAEKRHAETTREILQLEDGGEKPLAITDGSSSSLKRGELVMESTVPVNTWEYKNKNSLMYYPEGMDNPDDAIFKKPLLIKHENTRFKDDPFKGAGHQAKMAQMLNENKNVAGEKVGHDGKSILPFESPKVGGYGFVATPSPKPGVNETPLMTWGEIDSTPARLEPSATPGPAFRFPLESEREKLTHKMVDENTKKNRAKKQAALKQMKASVLGTPNRVGSIMSSERISMLSPAARRLVSRKFNLGTDKALKASYTPTPTQRWRSGNETPIVKTPTPRSQKTPKGTPTPKRIDITDNLLNIPKKQRKTASDFF